MSFKREGNDKSLLGMLRKRRIKDILSEDIPEDEAKLLCNGRFTCTVCSNHPIFDTVNMLTVHRNGKKHQHYQEIHSMKKKELRNLIRERQQDDIAKYGKTSVKMVSSKGNLQSSPYNPCVKKSRFNLKAGERKTRIDLVKEPQPSASTVNTSTSEHEKSVSAWKEICQQQTQGPVLHNRHLNNIFSDQESLQSSTCLKPYQSKASKGALQTQTLATPISTVAGLSSYQFTSLSTNMAHCSDTGQGNHTSHVSTGTASESYVTTSSKGLNVESRLKPTGDAKKEKSIHNKQKSTTTIGSGFCNSSHHQRLQSQEGSALATKYRLLQGSGWKKDWDGKWIKDEDAEFDSDEEPPDLP